MKILKFMIAALAAAAILNSAAYTQEPSVNNAERAIMVLDGSGSMWGQIDGKTKIEIAREVIGDLLGDWNSGAELGLIAYGHREKGACDDIETLVEVGPVDVDAVMAKVNTLNPKGKTPISASVRRAADALKYTEEKATVILVSDGLETCEADPCALANELEASGVDFTTHVIGFDVAEADAASLSCLAENTGGKFFSASNASELTTAMAETVAAVTEPEPEPAPAAEEEGVKLSAKLCESCEKLDEKVYWNIYAAETNAAGAREKVSSTGKTQPFMPLAPGDYIAQVSHGEVKREEPFTVEAVKTTTLDINLDAGNLRFKALATEGGEALDDKMYYRVYEAKTDLSGKRNQVTASGAAVPLFRLAAGDYVVEATHGKAKTQVPVTVTAGELTDETAVLNVGYLRLAATMAEGGAPLDKDVYYRVLEGKADLSGKRDQIDASAGATPLFRLPAGDYMIRANQDNAFVETPVSVTAGSLSEEMLVLNAGRIRAEGLAPGGETIDNGLYWRVFEAGESLDGKRTQIDASAGQTPIFALTAGDYVLYAKHGQKEAETPFSVAAGEEKVVTLTMEEE
ncbi:MAG: VWA domain-containing protein [Pseudomonadota bacterium]